MTIKAAIFDMDGTILDSMCVWSDMGTDYLRSIGITPPADLRQKIRTMSYAAAADYFISEFSLPHTQSELLSEWNKDVFDRYRRLATIKPGVREYIKKLYKSGVKICLATSSEKAIAREMLEKYELLPMFRFIITDADVGKGKTSPDIFLEAARLLDEQPSDCVVFEDSHHAIKTAVSAGFRVWGVEDEYEKLYLDEIRSMCERMIDFEEELKL